MRDLNPTVQTVKNRVADLRGKAATVGTGLLLAGGSAMATAFDSAPITSKITENVGVAVVIIGAFILGRWTLRSMGLLKG
jgi:hypothetical protein